MRIGLISDTHIPEVAERLPDRIKEVFQNVDLVLHAGDVYTVSVLNELGLIAPVLAACGDDDRSVTFRDDRMSDRQRLYLDGFCIVLQHYGPWFPPGENGQDVTGSSYKTTPLHTWYPDIVVCGHTHKARIEKSNGVLIVNPGSATFPGYKNRSGTVGLLTINSDHAEVQLVQL